MLLFTLVAGVMSAAAVALVWRALLAPRPRFPRASWRGVNRSIHAAELDALDSELAQEVNGAARHSVARDELLRRVLDEDAADDRPAVEAASPRSGLAVALAAPALGTLLYLAVGNPAMLAAADEVDPAARLQVHLRHARQDGRAWIALARLHMEASRYRDAAKAYEQALASGPAIAADAGVWCELADALGMAQGGSLRGRPSELIEKALALKPGHPRALEMAGSAAYEIGNHARTVATWAALLEQLSPESAEARELALALERVRGAHGLR